MTLERLTLEVAHGVAHLELNRPTAFNAIDGQCAHELRTVALQLQHQPEVRAILLTGAGKNFCVGGDLRFFAGPQLEARAAVGRTTTHELHAAVSLLVGNGAPLIVAVQGAVAGAGLALACAGDITLAAEDARFTVAYTGVGLTPDTGCSYFLPRLVGYQRAVELTLTNRTFSAREALDYGLVSRVVAGKGLAAEARELAERLASGPTAAFRTAKRLYQESLSNSLETQLENESKAFAAAGGGAEADEGMRAFLEKRQPRFERSPNAHRSE